MKCIFFILLFFITSAQRSSDEYNKLRKLYIANDITYGLSNADKVSDDDEQKAHEYFMSLNIATMNAIKKNASKDYLMQYFGKAKEEIEKTEEFEIIKLMPKGAALNAEIFGLGSAEMLIDIIKSKTNLYALKRGESYIFEYANEDPSAALPDGVLASTLSDEELLPLISVVIEPAETDANVESTSQAESTTPQDTSVIELVITAKYFDSETVVLNNTEIWKKYDRAYNNVKYITTHYTVYEDYLRKSIEELVEDGVSYIELRTGFDELHGHKNGLFNSSVVAEKLLFLARQLKNEEVLISLRVIYTPNRNDQNYVSKFKTFNAQLGTFLVGFDFQGRETEKHSLRSALSNINQLAIFYKRFFFTAGNSATIGTVEDDNLMDAILMDSERIHGASTLVYHPYAVEMVKNKNITILVNPIENQILHGLGKNIRSQATGSMIGNGIKVAIGCGAPGLFGGKGVSHNYYYILRATEGIYGGIKVIKTFLRTALINNRMSESERKTAQQTWKSKWSIYCRQMSTRIPKKQ